MPTSTPSVRNATQLFPVTHFVACDFTSSFFVYLFFKDWGPGNNFLPLQVPLVSPSLFQQPRDARSQWAAAPVSARSKGCMRSQH